jgi:hypothetical protein
MNESRAWISADSAVWALGLTAVAYAAAFGYEAGYAAYFGVPSALVEITLRGFVKSGLLLVVCLALGWLLHTLLDSLVEHLYVKPPIFISVMLTAAILYSPVILLLHLGPLFWVIVGMFAFGALSGLVRPILDRRQGFPDAEKRHLLAGSIGMQLHGRNVF